MSETIAHWRVFNPEGREVAWTQSQRKAHALVRRYPDADLCVEGPFVRVEALRALVETADAARSRSWNDPVSLRAFLDALEAARSVGAVAMPEHPGTQ